MESLLTINNLTLKINDKIFFEDFKLKVLKGSFTSILGVNGSGKTLLAKSIVGIYKIEGDIELANIRLDGANLLKYITNLGIVSNDFNQNFLFKKVKDELAYPIQNKK